MKSIFTLMVTIFMYSLSFGQNSNDCNITPNKQDYQNFIIQDYNVNAKSLNDFLSLKKKERDDLKKIERKYGITTDKDDNKDYTSEPQSSFERFVELRDYLTRIMPNRARPEGKYHLEENEYVDINELKILVRQNLGHLETDERLKSIIDGIANIEFEILLGEPDPYKEPTKSYKIPIKTLDSFIALLYKVNITDFNTCAEIINQNLQNVEFDIRNAENKLNEITSINLSEFEFKKNITLIVGILIGIILISFFTGVLYKATDAIKQKLIGETGLQFITIFVIIIAVILFGVMNILKGSELAAILSAIAGYILGKTATPKSDKTLEIELEILRLKSQEAERLKQEEADKKVGEAAEAIKKQEEEKRKLEIEAENKKLEAEEMQDDINPDTTNDSVKEDIDQVAEILSEDTDVNTIEKSDESGESNEGIDEKKIDK